MKRFIALICVLALLMSVTAFAADGPVLTASGTVSEDGSTVTVVVSITDGSELCGCSLDLVYDPEVLQCESVTVGDAVKNTTFISNAEYDNDTIRVAWMSAVELGKDGEVVTVTFKTAPGTSKQSTNIAVENVDAFDVQSNSVEAATVGTSVEVEGGKAGDQSGSSSSNGQGSGGKDNTGNKTPTGTADPEVFLMEFVDVDENAYYYNAVCWAVEHEITAGTTPTTFSPLNPCNRAQTVTFLWRAAGCPEPALAACSFTDVNPDAYYYDAVLWAVEQGITTGTSTTTFSPDAPVTRGQVVTFLWRAEGQPAAAGGSPFTDVVSGAYYDTAVNWAVNEGITNGTSATTFGPDDPCVRGQIVTFLYRCFV